MANCDSLNLRFAELREVFPLLSDETILLALNVNKNDLEGAIEHILTNGGIEEEEKDKKEESIWAPVISQEVTELQRKTNLLFDMFPTIDTTVISHALKQNDLDLGKTAEELLSKDAIDQMLKNNDNDDVEKGEEHRSDITLNQVDGEADELVQLTEIPLDEVKQYLQRHESKSEALVDIIRNHRKKLQEPTKRSQKKIPKGGRVQGSYNKLRLDAKDDYTYNENSPEVKELADYVYHDKSLSEIHWSFYEELLIFFRGDISKVITAAIIIYENNGIKATYTSPQPKLSFRKVAESLQKAQTAQVIPRSRDQGFISVSNKKRPSLFSTVRSDTEEGLEKYEIAMQRLQLTKARETRQLDLHGFNVRNARLTCSRALREWWKDELQAREVNGNATPGTKAREISPLTVITGRGIHSEGGFSKVRASIKKLLDNSEYLFEEEASRFIIYGRKA